MRPFRASVAGLMGIVLVVALGLTAMRSDSPTWAGATFLAACGVLALSTVGAACRDGAERAWWLGFCLFGWGYLLLASGDEPTFSTLPTTALLRLIAPRVLPESRLMFGGRADEPYFDTGHSLFAIAAAALGGLAALGLFSGARAPAGGTSIGPSPEGRTSRGVWRRRAVVGLAVVIAALAAVAVGLARVPGQCAAGAFFATWGALCLAVVGAASNRGRARAVWLGAALFGVGYMGLTFRRPGVPGWPQVAIGRMLQAVRGRLPWIARGTLPPGGEVGRRNALILEALERPVEMLFPHETPLEDVLQYTSSKIDEIQGFDFYVFYVDPTSLERAGKTLQSPIILHVEGLPLRDSLRLVLAQLGLMYRVEEGLLKVTTLEPVDWGRPPPASEDPFLVVGHCVLGLLAAVLGGLLGPLVCPRVAGRIAA